MRFHARRSAYTAVAQRHDPGALEFRMARALWAEWSANWVVARRADSGGGRGRMPKRFPPPELETPYLLHVNLRRVVGRGVGRLEHPKLSAKAVSQRAKPLGRGGQAAGHS